MRSVSPVISEAADEARKTTIASHFHGLADAVEGGDAVNGVGQVAQVGEILFSAWRADKRGGAGVHADSMFAPFDARHFVKWAMPALVMQ